MSDKVIFSIVTAIVIAILAITVTGLVVVGGQRKEMFDKCMADGKKDYECHAMIYGRCR